MVDGAPTERVSTGVDGLDRILGGGLFKGGIYLVGGRPGAGKTILGNQLCYSHVKRGGKALYVTLLAETHARMLQQLRGLSFFDGAAVGSSVFYVNGFSALVEDGLKGLLQLVRRAVRDHKATVVILDGLTTSTGFANKELDYKRFINELQTWVSVVGATVLLLSSGTEQTITDPEHTMVDGIFELHTAPNHARSARQLRVTKMRSTAFAEGCHGYAIRGDGLTVYPRLEALFAGNSDTSVGPDRLEVGIKGFDKLIGGGVSKRSTTLLLGSSGSGKTLWGLHFLKAGLDDGEKAMHYGFFENPPTLRETSKRLRLGFDKHEAKGQLSIHWRRDAEQSLDCLGHDLLTVVDREKPTRLFLDGLVGFKTNDDSERLASFFAALTQELQRKNVTTFVSEETRELYVQTVEVPTGGVSAIFQNIFFLRQNVGSRRTSRIVSVMKVRDAEHTAIPHTFVITNRGLVVDGEYASGSSSDTGVGLVPTLTPIKRRRGGGR